MMEIYELTRNLRRSQTIFDVYPWTVQFLKGDYRDLWHTVESYDVLSDHADEWLVKQKIDYAIQFYAIYVNLLFKTQRDAIMFKLFFG